MSAQRGFIRNAADSPEAPRMNDSQPAHLSRIPVRYQTLANELAAVRDEIEIAARCGVTVDFPERPDLAHRLSELIGAEKVLKWLVEGFDSQQPMSVEISRWHLEDVRNEKV